MKTLIDFIYTLLIGASVVLFVGLGIWTFYSGPKMPDYPRGPNYYTEPTKDQQKQLDQNQQKFDKAFKKYEDEQKPYNRNVSAIALGAGVVFFLVGLLLMRRNDIIGEGLALGGVFTEVYAAVRAVSPANKPFVFASVCLILVMLVLLALFRRR
ncbi:hypothetical protein KW794_03080, partial [Candidatus Saccharibacteria bacterium]|nr:hypothetical protein [Candidatus Saccharibacteria bacterium]